MRSVTTTLLEPYPFSHTNRKRKSYQKERDSRRLRSISATAVAPSMLAQEEHSSREVIECQKISAGLQHDLNASYQLVSTLKRVPHQLRQEAWWQSQAYPTWYSTSRSRASLQVQQIMTICN